MKQCVKPVQLGQNAAHRTGNESYCKEVHVLLAWYVSAAAEVQ
jgi:hypothetical protein